MNLANLEIELALDEGNRAFVYNDSRGIPTVGIGHNCRANPLDPTWTFPLTEDQTMQLFTTDVGNATEALDQYAPWWSSLDEVRQRAIANMTFNMGWAKLSQFNQFLGFMENGLFDSAATDLRGTPWFQQVGSAAPDPTVPALVNGQRGWRIASMIATGVSPYPGVVDQ